MRPRSNGLFSSLADYIKSNTVKSLADIVTNHLASHIKDRLTSIGHQQDLVNDIEIRGFKKLSHALVLVLEKNIDVINYQNAGVNVHEAVSAVITSELIQHIFKNKINLPNVYYDGIFFKDSPIYSLPSELLDEKTLEDILKNALVKITNLLNSEKSLTNKVISESMTAADLKYFVNYFNNKISNG